MSILEYLQDVLSGKVAAQGALGQNNYDPQASFAQNTLNPTSLQQAMDVAMGFSGGGLATRGPRWEARLNKALSAGDITVPTAVTEAKYIMPDGRLVGSGDEMHEYIAHLLGYGTRGEDSVEKMLQATGATRINNAAALFDKAAPSVSLSRPPTSQQMSQLDRYLKQSGGADVSFGGQFGRAERGADLARLIAAGRRGLLE